VKRSTSVNYLVACALLAATFVPAQRAHAQCDPAYSLSTYVTAADAPVSIFSLPNGGGNPVTACYEFGESEPTDATITVTVIRLPADGGDPYPVPDFPLEDIWLDSMGFSLRPCYESAFNGIHPDSNTDENGQTTFTAPFHTGGQTDLANDPLMVLIGGCPPLQDGLDIAVNTPDIDANWVVDLIDVTLFAIDILNQTGDYRSDFWWDGVINLSDLALFAQGYGTACP